MNFRSDVAFNELEEKGLIFPHGVHPGSYPGGFNLILLESDWNAYTWNPPQAFPELGVDASAGTKPTWAELQSAFFGGYVANFKFDILPLLRNSTERLISVKAYGAKDPTHERQIKERLAGDVRLTRMNEYKDHFRTRYHEIKHWINSITEDSSGHTKIVAWENANIVFDSGNLRKTNIDDNLYALFSGATWTPPGEQTVFADHANVPTYEYIHHENPPPTTTESSL